MKPANISVDEFSKWAGNSGTDGEMRSLGGSGSVQDRWMTKLRTLGFTGDVATMQQKWVMKTALVGTSLLKFIPQSVALRRNY